MRRLAVAVVLLLVAPVHPATPKEPLPESLTGRVVSVADGDTVTVLVDRIQHKIRLDSIDCPERGQPFGTRARQFTSGAVFGKPVTVRVTDKDRYGRYVGRVIYQGKDEKGKPVSLDLSVDLVRVGLAWWYREYAPKDKQLAKLETEAREAKRGLWSDPHAVAPWEWRHRGRKSTPPAGDGSGEYWLNTSSGVRHNSTCRYFKNTKQGRPCGPNEGKPCKLCGG